MVSLVPTDLLEYPAITYFQHRNQGQLTDIDITKQLISRYMDYHGKNPRELFMKGYVYRSSVNHWSRPQRNSVFDHSISFSESVYRPIASEVLSGSKYRPVLRTACHRYRHKKYRGKKPGSALVFIHGYAENRFLFHAHSYFRFFQKIFDCDIHALELPYHFRRQPADSPFSGAYFLNGNPVRMLEAIRQSIQEIILLVEQLKGEYNRVILYGISLGGHLAALSTQFLEGIDIIAALASPFIFRLATRTKIVPVADKIVSQQKESGHTSRYRILYPTNLKYFAPFTTNKNTAIIGGLFDRIIPFSF
ncbi:MAG: hypothetical protein ACTSP4_15705, partial [Candidatus Hodarchaeales archaeon]